MTISLKEVTIQFRCTPEGRDRLCANAKANNQTLSDYIRTVLFNTVPTPSELEREFKNYTPPLEDIPTPLVRAEISESFKMPAHHPKCPCAKCAKGSK